MRSTRLLFLLLGVSALLALALWWNTQGKSEYQVFTLFGDQARELPELSLLRHDGQALQVENFQGRWSLVFFGYSRCPDICSPTLQQLTQALKQANLESVQLIFVSVDPQRDNPESLTQYVRHFHPTTIGITGSDKDINAFAEHFGAFHAQRKLSTGYLVDHSSAVWLINPKAQLAGVFTAPFATDAVASDLKQLIEQS